MVVTEDLITELKDEYNKCEELFNIAWKLNDDENTTISETTINRIADICINCIKQELNANDKPCTFEICHEISERIKQRLFIRTF